MNLEFMKSERLKHPYWNKLKFPTEEEMKIVFKEAMSSKDEINIFVAEYNNKVVGYANTWCVYSIWTMGKSLIIDDLYICQEYRNKGYGKEVMKYLINYAKLNRCKRVQLNAEKNNIIAQNLYKKLDFADEDMVFFMKKLYE